MALITIYVDPDASGNNDGTSPADAYTDLKFAVDQRKTNLVGSGDSHIYLCRSSAGTPNLLTSSIALRDYVTSPTENVTIQMDLGEGYHFGVWDDLKYRIVAAASTIIFNARGEDITIRFLQIDYTALTGTTICIQNQLASGENVSLFDSLVLRSDDGEGRGLVINNLGTDLNSVCRIRNIIAWGGDQGIRVTGSANMSYFVDNCTVDGAAVDNYYMRTATQVRIRNCVATRSPDGFDNTGLHADSTNNASDTSDAPGFNPVDLTGIGIETLFVAPNTAQPNLHILPGTVLDTGGADLTGAVDQDIDLEDRSVPYSIGADQIPAATGVNFDIKDVNTGPVTVGSPVLQVFLPAFVPNNLNTGPVDVTSPTFQSFLQSFNVDDVSTGAVVIDSPTVGTTQPTADFDVKDLQTGAVVITSPTVTETESFDVNPLSTGAVAISEPTLGVTPDIAVDDLSTGPVTIDAPALNVFLLPFTVLNVATGAVNITSPTYSSIVKTEFIRGFGTFSKSAIGAGKFMRTVSGKGTLLEDTDATP